MFETHLRGRGGGVINGNYRNAIYESFINLLVKERGGGGGLLERQA